MVRVHFDFLELIVLGRIAVFLFLPEPWAALMSRGGDSKGKAAFSPRKVPVMPPHLRGGSGGHKVQPRTLFGAFSFLLFFLRAKQFCVVGV